MMDGGRKCWSRSMSSFLDSLPMPDHRAALRSSSGFDINIKLWTTLIHQLRMRQRRIKMLSMKGMAVSHSSNPHLKTVSLPNITKVISRCCRRTVLYVFQVIPVLPAVEKERVLRLHHKCAFSSVLCLIQEYHHLSLYAQSHFNSIYFVMTRKSYTYHMFHSLHTYMDSKVGPMKEWE